MIAVLVAVAVGVVVGVAGGGRPAYLATARLRWTVVLGLGAMVQAAAELGRVPAGAGFAVVVGSYALLGAFALRNLGLRGMAVVALGIALNLVPILADRGMPVERSAIVRAGVAADADVAALGYGAKRHLALPGDHARVLDDRIPEWLAGEVLSFGDLVIAVGVAVVVAGLLRPRGGRASGLRGSAVPSSDAGPDRRASGSTPAASL